MASPSTVLSLGYGSFGSVNLLPTLGFGAGEEAEVVPDDDNTWNPGGRGRTWYPDGMGRTWYPDDKGRTWKV